MLELSDSTYFRGTLHFLPTFLTELAVIAAAARDARRRRRLFGLGRRLKVAASSGLWCLPIYLWAWQANRLAYDLVSAGGLTPSNARSWEQTVVTIFVSLFYLLALQTIGTVLTRSAPATLGMVGQPRTAATAAMLSVFLHLAFLYRL